VAFIADPTGLNTLLSYFQDMAVIAPTTTPNA